MEIEKPLLKDTEDHIYKISIPYDPMNWNEYINVERANKFGASSVKKREKQVVLYTVKQRKNKRYEGSYPCKITIYPHFKNKRKDLDNTRFKGIIDGLVSAKVIDNDNLNHIQEIVMKPIFDNLEKIDIKIEELKK